MEAPVWRGGGPDIEERGLAGLKKFGRPQQVNKELLASQSHRRGGNSKLVAILIGLMLGAALGEIVITHAWRYLRLMVG